MNYYELLGVSKDASPDDIKRAYRRQASKHHPDKGGDTKKFQEIQTAYDTLSDPNKRANYDSPQQGPRANFHNGTGDPGLDEIFRQFGFGGRDPFAHLREQQQRRNKDLRIDLAVPLSETLGDVEKTLNIRKPNGENQNISITVPRGTTSGTTMKYPGLGDNMFNNLPPGNLLVQVHVLEDQGFSVAGLDLVTVLTIDCFEAILGCKKQVTGLDGKIFAIQVPQACQPGTKLKIPGEGLWAFQQDVQGNLYVQVTVNIPTNLSDEHKQILQTITNQR